jgi:signal transduction histidine kinase
VSKQYEKAGNYEQAYRAELRRMQVRDSLRAIYLNRLVTQYEENFHNQDLEMTRVRLLDQNVRMEVEQMESAGEVERLREEQDSINIDNARIQLNNATAQEELAEKQRQLQEAEMQRQWVEQRRSVIFLWFVVALILVVLGFCVYFLIVRARLNAVLRNEREQAREALQRAELANRTQNHFMQQFNEVIQQPAEEICAASRTLCEGTTSEVGETEMEKIRRKTAMLLNQVEDIGNRCNEGFTRKALIWVCLLGLSLSGLTLQAQNNSYGIPNDEYQYYKRCDRMVQEPAVMAMTDTLFEMGRRSGHSMTQCLAYNVRVGHAYFMHNIDSIRAEQRKLYDFVSKTPYTDQLYLGWNRIIIHYLDNNQFYEAMTETKAYQQDALRHNNLYGVARGFYYFGEIYRMRGMYDEAVRQYNNAIEYQVQNGGSTRIQNASCTRIGEIYIALGRYDEAKRYLTRALATVNYDYEEVNPTIELFKMYVNQGDLTQAEEERQKIEKFDKDGLLIGTRILKYKASLVRYHLLRHEYFEALQCAEEIANKDPETLSQVKAAVGYYEEALFYLRQAVCNEEETAASLDVSRLLSLRTEYDSMLIAKQNSLLKLRQSQLRLEQLQHEKELSAEQNQRDSIALNNQLLQQEAITQAGRLREAEIASKMEEMKHAEQTAQYQHRILGVVVALLLFILACLLIAVRMRRRANKALRREIQATEAASLAAEEATERKRRFMLQVSHEVRTPLNTIIGFNEVLSDPTLCEALPEADREEMRRRCREATESFQSLVRNTLALSRIESGVYQPQPEEVNLKELIQETIQQCSTKLRKGVHINTISNEVDAFCTDRMGLRTIVTHLLDNACKFTDEGSITVDYRVRNDRLYVMVSDTGCGVPKEKAETIFANFAKLNEFVPGIGLGLSLCRSMVKLLGGSIELDTEYTEGCRFVVTLQPLG